MHYQLPDETVAYLKENGVPAFADRTIPDLKKRPVVTPKPPSKDADRRVHCASDSHIPTITTTPTDWAKVTDRTERVIGKLLTPKPPRRIVLGLPAWFQRTCDRIRHALGRWSVLFVSLLVTSWQVNGATTRSLDSNLNKPVATHMARTNENLTVGTLILQMDLDWLQFTLKDVFTESHLITRRLDDLGSAPAFQQHRLEALDATLTSNVPAITIVEGSLFALDASLADLAVQNDLAVTRLQALEESAKLVDKRLRHVELLLWVMAGMISLSLAFGFWRFETSLRRLERLLVAQHSEHSHGSSRTLIAASQTDRSRCQPIIGQRRKVPDTVPSPTELLQRIATAAKRTIALRHVPAAPVARPWGMGLASSKGPVRHRNEDYALAFEFNDHQVLLIADGVGGMPHGQMAAYHAVRAAAWQVVRLLGQRRSASSETVPETIAAGALEHAARSLSCVARRYVETPENGFRTTLIVVVASQIRYGFCYLGDGGGCIRRINGNIEQFLVPQKADPDMPNVLAGCLGPTVQGKPVAGTLIRRHGDLLISGTDGVMDRLGDDYASRPWDAAAQTGGNLQALADLVIEQMGSAQDEHGYICDDNLTIGLMGQETLSAKKTTGDDGILLSSHGSQCLKFGQSMAAAQAAVHGVLGQLAGRLGWRTSRTTGDRFS